MMATRLTPGHHSLVEQVRFGCHPESISAFSLRILTRTNRLTARGCYTNVRQSRGGARCVVAVAYEKCGGRRF